MRELDLSIPSYTLAEVAEATGVLVGTIRGWAQRGELVVGEGDITTVVAGATRRVTGRGAIAIAMANALMHPEHRRAAFLAAKAFAYTGDANRGIAEAFRSGFTFAAATGEDKFLITNDFDRLRSFIVTARGKPVTVVDVEPIYRTVLDNLKKRHR